MKILIVKLSAMGDVIHTLPLVRLIRKNFKKAEIDWIVNRSYVSLLRGNLDINNIIEFPAKELKENFINKSFFSILLRMRKVLSQKKYTFVIDAQGLAKSALCAFFSPAGSRIGFNSCSSRELAWLLYDKKLNANIFGPSVVSMNMGLASLMGLFASRKLSDRSKALDPGNSVPWLTPDNSAREKASFFMKKLFNNKSFILISPCAGWQTKEWPPKMYAALANLLQEKFNIFCAVIWAGQREKKIALQITDNSKALFLPETDINEMLAFIEKSTLFIGGDTGPMHAANFMGIPVAALYFASDSIRNGPWFQPAVTITPPIICRPCKKRTCPRPLCLEKLSASDVFNAISQRFEGLFHEKG